MEFSSSVVSVERLHVHLNHPALKSHIPGALFFDIDRISDPTTQLPHMLPSEEAFAAAVSALGISNQDKVVVYDGKGIFSAPRVWWMFRVFGHENIWVLDGGMPKWRDFKFDVESSDSNDAVLKASLAHEAIEKVYKGELVPPFTFQTKLQPHLVWTHKQGLHRLGKTNIPVYDGSWTEWVTHPDTLNIVEVAETL